MKTGKISNGYIQFLKKLMKKNFRKRLIYAFDLRLYGNNIEMLKVICYN
ncbi:hypothetical protein [Clostridium pasteurianum]|nr:hypothetical protein [Clostridium pasteurianum]